LPPFGVSLQGLLFLVHSPGGGGAPGKGRESRSSGVRLANHPVHHIIIRTIPYPVSTPSPSSRPLAALLLLTFLIGAAFLTGCSAQQALPTVQPTIEQDTPDPTRPLPPAEPAPEPAATALPPTPAPPQTAAPTHTPVSALLEVDPVCQEKEGRFEIGQLPTPLLREPLDFRVFLPPCYGFDPHQRYPVLYLIHGQSYNDDQWERLGAGRTASALITGGEIAPFLIVMPRDRLWSQPTEDNFGRAVVEVLIPWIDENYTTRPERQYRAVGGLSRGAGWAVHLGLSSWELFGAIGGHSLPVFWTDTYYIRRWLGQIPEGQMPRIYLDIGDKDRPEIMNSALWFEELLTQQNIAHEWYLFRGYHEEKYWETNLERYLRWYASPWSTD
jgi:enterochelin esterase-like enzyme